MNNQSKRGGWSNPASRSNGTRGGRPRTRIALRGPGAMYVWAVARQQFGRDATEEQAETILEEMVAEYARSHRVADKDE